MTMGERLAGWQKAEAEEKRRGGLFVLWIFWTIAICIWFFSRPKLKPVRLTPEQIDAIDAADEAAAVAKKGIKKKKRMDGAAKARAAREAAEAKRRAKEAAADAAAEAAPLRTPLSAQAEAALLPSDDEEEEEEALHFNSTNKGMKKQLAANQAHVERRGYRGPVRLGARPVPSADEGSADATFWDMGEDTGGGAGLEGENSEDAGWVGVRAPSAAPAKSPGFKGAVRLGGGSSAPNTAAGAASAALARSTMRGNAPAPSEDGAPALTKKQRESKRKKERAKFLKNALREQAQTESTGHAERTILSLQKRGALG